MSKQAISLEAQPREKLGTRTTRRLRRTGQLPAVVYGHKQEPVSISLPHKETVRHLMAGSHLFDLQLSGSKETVLIKDVQYDHLGTEIIHIDLARVDLTEKVTVTIPLHFKGTPDSTVSGIVSHDLADLEVECLVTEIPEGITVDVSGMKDGGHIAVHDLKLPAGVTAVTEGDVSVAHVAAVGTQVDDEAALEATDEPEVIAKGKGEEEGDEK